MSHTIGGIVVDFVDSNRKFHHWWTDYSPSVRVLPAGWQRDPDRLALREDLIWEKDVPIPLRDGVILRGDIFRPANKEGTPLPALLPWSPYGKTGTGSHQTTEFTYLGVPKEALSGLEKFEAPDPAEWCPRGYAVVQVDARGCYDSEGDIFVFGTQEGKDGYDTIEWIAQQKWSDGNVALVGNSWLACAQWFIAAEQPPHLKAIAPWEGLGDFYRQSICRGGIPNWQFWQLLMNEFNGKNKREDVASMIAKYPHMNPYWEDKNPRLQDIKVPMYVLASYSTGLHTEGSIRGWKYAGSENKWLRIHPTQEWHDIYQSGTNDELQRFLDHFLLGKQNGWQLTPKVRVSLLRYNRDPIVSRPEDHYPPSRTDYKTYYLDAASGSLGLQKVDEESSIQYDSESWDDEGAHFSLKFDRPTELLGCSKVKLFMSCPDHDDMDTYVIIRKIDRTGKPLLSLNIPMKDQRHGVTEDDIPDHNIYKYVGPNGRLRASKRYHCEEPGMSEEMKSLKYPTELWYPHDKEEKLASGEVVELDIAIWPGGIAFDEGESMRLEIKGHDPILPEYPPLHRAILNLNKGTHIVHTGGKHASSITLPLINT